METVAEVLRNQKRNNELLEALENLVERLDDRPDLRWPRLEQPLAEARAAIAKAKG